MTTIIARKNNWKLELSWDKRIVLMNNTYDDNSNKIIKLDNILLWKSWDSIEMILIKELYNKYVKENGLIKNVMSAISFINYIKANCNINVEWWIQTNFIILHKDFQILIDFNWQILDLNTTWWMLAMWSWSIIAESIIKCYDYYNNENIDLTDLYKLVSELDPYTSSNFDVIYL